MKKVIWKYQLIVTDRQEIKMPAGAEILTVQTQDGRPCLWALVAPNKTETTRIIETFGTGHEVNYFDTTVREYIGTYQLEGGQLVFHVFERK